jgi:gliding motility associated protien GldN
MKKQILFITSLVALISSAFAQQQNQSSILSPLDDIYVKENIQFRDPLPYPSLREADVMWSKKIWRIIDLKEKINLPLGQPASGSTRDRKSLIDVLMDGVKDGAITAYSKIDDQFTLPSTMSEIETEGGARVDTQRLNRPDPPYDEYDTIVKKDFSRDDVIAYRVKEEWFFDRQRSVMDVRIIGIAPLVYAKDESGNVRADNSKKLLCWFYYPEIRKILHSSETFNRQNDAERRSFEDIFEKRMFNSYIFKESNVYDRRIDEYKEGIAQLYESERIKEEIVNFEHDMWEY